MEKSCGAIIIDKGKVLLIYSKSNEVGFPKGHMEMGETEEETALREVKEETNLDIEIVHGKKYKTSYFLPNGNYKEVTYFLAHPIGDKKVKIAEDELTKYEWVELGIASSYFKTESLKEILEDLSHSNKKFEYKKIRLSDRQFKLFTGIVKKYKRNYNREINELRRIDAENLNKFSLEKEKELTERHNKLLKTLLENIAKEFKIFKRLNITIVITGSFARYTNKLNSDIDIQFLYPNILKPIIWKYEELFYLCVSELMDFDREKIHAVITTKQNKEREDYYNNLNDDTYLKVIMYCKKKFGYSYNFYPTTKKRFYLQYKNDKSIKAFEKYFLKEIKYANREWSHNFYAVTNKKGFEKTINRLHEVEKTNEYMLENIDNIIGSINTSYTTSNNIIDIKKYYQQRTFGNIFNVLNIVRFIEDDNIFNIKRILSYRIFTESKKNSKIESLIYEYLWLVKKVAYYCSEHNIPYSIHKPNIVKIPFINEVINIQDELNKEIRRILEESKEKINER